MFSNWFTMNVHIRRVVIDSLKARETSLLDLSKALASVEGVEEVDMNVTEVDVRTETVRITIRGPSIDYDGLSRVMNEHGATVRSVDEINVVKLKIRPKSEQHV